MFNLQTTHTVVHLSITASNATTLPVIVELDDPECPKISYSAAQYARYLQREGHASYATILKSVHAIGKLRDFYILVHQCGSLDTGDVRNLLEDFLYALDVGSVLGWKSASNIEFLVARAAVADYVKFVANHDGGLLSASEVDAQFVDKCRQAFVGASHAHKSLLFHTKKRSLKKSRGRSKAVTGLQQYKPFPPHLVDELIKKTHNIRDKILFASAAFGGRRISEYLHLFLEDVEVNGSSLNMTLRHPTQAPMIWRNIAGRKMNGTRREYLKSTFNLMPRTEHGANSSKVGWKGIKFEDLAKLSSNVYFIREAEEELAKLHRQYLHEFLPRLPKTKHPYYFVSELGIPLTVKGVEKQFSLACARLERLYGISLKGYGLHSLRHYYGFFHADVLKTDILLIRQYMGHIQLTSTAIYAHISPETAKRALAEAENRAKHEGRIEMGSQERERIETLYTDSAVPRIDLGLARHGTTAFGELDTKKIMRKTR